MKRLLLLVLLLAASAAQAAGVFVAVSTETGATNAESLASGTTWTGVNTGTSLALNGVAYGNGIFCAVGSNASTISYRSSNGGATWASGGLVGHKADAIGYGNGVFVVVAGQGAGFSATSPDCVTWTAGGTFGVSVSPKAVAWDSVHSVFLVVVGTTDLWTSPDSGTWTKYGGALPSSANFIASCGGTSVAFGAFGVSAAIVSTDGGATWTSAALTAMATWTSIACSDALHFTIVSSAGDVDYTTGGGATWSAGTGLSTLGATSIAWNGAEYAVVAPTTTAFAHSADGQTFTVESTGAISLAAPALAASLAGPAPSGAASGSLLLMGIGQ